MVVDVLKRRKISLIIGKTGYGKSRFVKEQVLPLLKRVIILDVNNEYTYSDFHHFTDFYQFRDWIVAAVENPTATDKAVVTFPIVGMTTDEILSNYEAVMETILIAEDFTIIVEEAHQYGSSASIVEPLEKLIRFGRHRRISIVGISQRLNDLHNIVRNNADLLVVFNLTARADIDYLDSLEYVGGQAAMVPQLKRDEYLTFWNI